MSNALPLDGSHLDVVALVQADHRAVRAYLTLVEDASPQERGELWPGVVRMIVAHEVAEEVVLLPAVRVVTIDRGAILDDLLVQQAEVETSLERLEAMDQTSPEFALYLGAFRQLVLVHAEAEERDVLPLIMEFDEALDRPALGARYETAKRRAPTHPHPRAPDRPPGNLVVGPVAALFDRMRDHMR